MRSKEKVQAAVLERLETKTGLDMKALDVTTTVGFVRQKTSICHGCYSSKG